MTVGKALERIDAAKAGRFAGDVGFWGLFTELRTQLQQLPRSGVVSSKIIEEIETLETMKAPTAA